MADHIAIAESVLETAARPRSEMVTVLMAQYAKAQAEATLAIAQELRRIRYIMEGV